jgi:AAA15 family ATPase/GTPase
MQFLTVKNFGPIKDAHLQVNAFTVLIGEHASGKSTLAKLVYFFKSLKKDFVELARLDPNEINTQRVKNKIRDKFYLYFGSTRLLATDYSVKFSWSDDKSLTLSGSPLQVQLRPLHWLNELNIEITNSSPAINFYRMRNEFELALKEERKLEEKLGSFFHDYTEAFFIPAGRNITTSYPETFIETFFNQLPQLTAPKVDEDGNLRRNDPQKINLYLIRDFIGKTSLWKEEFRGSRGISAFLKKLPQKKELLSEIEKLLKGTYQVTERLGEHIVLGEGQIVLLENASSGQQESIRIIQDVVLSLADEKSVFRVIEEPEAHLFPSGQEALTKLLVALTNYKVLQRELKNGVLITTHSPYILTILNNLIFAGVLNAYPNADNPITQAGIPPIFRLQPENISAYMVTTDGQCTPINHTAKGKNGQENTGMIGVNNLENYWHSLQNQFDELMEVEI